MFTTLALTAALALGSAPQSASPQGYGSSAALSLPANSSLLEAVRAFERASGQTILLEGTSPSALKEAGLVFDRPLQVPAEHGIALFEALMAEHGFAVVLEDAGESSGLVIVNPSDASQDELLERALDASIEEVLGWEQHSALLVRTLVQVPGLTQRYLSNSMRSMVVDGRLHAIRYDAEADAVELIGPARWTRNLLQTWLAGPEAGPDPALDGPRYEPQGQASIPASASMEELLIAEGARSGQRFLWSADAQEALRGARLALSNDLSIPQDRAREFLGGMLAEAGFVTVDYSLGDFDLCAVVSSRGDQVGTVRGRARFVALERVPMAATSPSQLIATKIDMGGVDARQLSNSWRSIVNNANLQQLLPLGDGSGLMLLGPASWVESQKEALELVIRANAGEELEERQATPRPTVSEPVEVSGDVSLLDLMIEIEGKSDARFLVLVGARQALAESSLPMLGTAMVPADNGFVVFEEILAQSGFALYPWNDSLLIVPAETAGVSSWLSAEVVSASAMDSLARMPAGHFSVLLHTPHRDTRSLSNSMRVLAFHRYARMIPVGATPSMLVSGPGAWVESTMRLLMAEEGAAAHPQGKWGFSEPLTMSGETSLNDALGVVGERSGVRFTCSATVRSKLDQTPLGIAELTLEGETARSSFEQLMAMHGFALRQGAPGTRVEEVVDVSDEEIYPLSGARFVRVEEASQLTSRPATLVSVLVPLPGASVRDLTKGLRPLIQSARTQSISPFGSEEAVLVRGPGPWVARMVDLLQLAAGIEQQAAPVADLPEFGQRLALEDGSRLLQAVEQFEAGVAPQRVMIDPATRQALASVQLNLPATLRVPASRAPRALGSLLLEHGFSLCYDPALGSGGFSIVALDRLGESFLGRGIGVSLPARSSLTDQPSLHVHTIIQLRGVDVTQLMQTPQAKEFQSAPGRSMVALENPSRVVLVGPSSEVADLADKLQRANAPEVR